MAVEEVFIRWEEEVREFELELGRGIVEAVRRNSRGGME